jgi:hypothetical protein
MATMEYYNGGVYFASVQHSAMHFSSTAFNNLKLVLQVHSRGTEVVVNQHDTFYLHYPPDSKLAGVIFAYVQQRKDHIIFYFHPLAANEKLFNLCSPGLQAALQNDSRFLLPLDIEPVVIRELQELTHIAMSVSNRHYQPLFRTTFLN